MWGKLTLLDGRHRHLAVHPHVCGENLSAYPSTGGISGSPPRVWGKRRRSPTHHGLRTVHPHVCGENAMSALNKVEGGRFTPTCVGKTRRRGWPVGARCGSPPRVWGKLTSYASLSRCRSVHPHVCGENVRITLLIHRLARFTPTCVGKTGRVRASAGPHGGSPPRVWGKRSVPSRLFPSRTVHPHVCGENGYGALLVVPKHGSPPRVWGKLSCTSGNTSGRTVHPHVCGENLWGPSGMGEI